MAEVAAAGTFLCSRDAKFITGMYTVSQKISKKFVKSKLGMATKRIRRAKTYPNESKKKPAIRCFHTKIPKFSPCLS